MGAIRPSKKAKLFIGLISADPALIQECAASLSKQLGPLDLESETTPWDYSGYYQQELGSGLLRKFIFFEKLIDEGNLPGIKHLTNRLEAETSVRDENNGKRRINLDPGYVTEAKVVLASTKDFAHRLYVGESMYAEVTLRYGNKERDFVPFDHTYPEFRADAYRAMFMKGRELLRKALQDEKGKLNAETQTQG